MITAMELRSSWVAGWAIVAARHSGYSHNFLWDGRFSPGAGIATCLSSSSSCVWAQAVCLTVDELTSQGYSSLNCERSRLPKPAIHDQQDVKAVLHVHVPEFDADPAAADCALDSPRGAPRATTAPSSSRDSSIIVEIDTCGRRWETSPDLDPARVSASSHQTPRWLVSYENCGRNQCQESSIPEQPFVCPFL
jgi:hypothetical protein